jgi:hypothetical protein
MRTIRSGTSGRDEVDARVLTELGFNGAEIATLGWKDGKRNRRSQ